MKGYALFQKGKDRPIRIVLQNDQGEWADVLVFAEKKQLKAAVDVEYDEEIKRVEIKPL